MRLKFGLSVKSVNFVHERVLRQVNLFLFICEITF